MNSVRIGKIKNEKLCNFIKMNILLQPVTVIWGVGNIWITPLLRPWVFSIIVLFKKRFFSKIFFIILLVTFIFK